MTPLPSPEAEGTVDSLITDAAPHRERLSSVRRRMVRLLVLFGMSYFTVCMMLVFLQRKLIYVPRSSAVAVEDAGLHSAVNDVSLAVSESVVLRGWHCQYAPVSAAQSRWLVILFPGNAGNRLNRVGIIEQFLDLNCDALIVDYRGYGGSDGHPTEEHLAADSLAVWKYATQELGYPADKIVLFGQSLGGGVATRLAWELCQANTPPAGLMLRATFTSLVDAAQHNYPWLPVSLLLVDRYPSIDRIGQIDCPVLITHGQLDTIVPHQLGYQLYEAAPDHSASGVRKRFQSLPKAGHNDIMLVAHDEVRTATEEFLAALRSVPQEAR